MKYVPPLGATDPNASYVEGNPGLGVRGSYLTAAAVENPMREIMAVIGDGDIAPSDTDLTQLLQAIQVLIARAIAAIQFPAPPTIPTYGATEGVKDVSNVFSLDFPDLTEEDVVAANDLVAYYSENEGHHRKTSIQNFAAVMASFYAAVFVPRPTSAASVTATYAVAVDLSVGSNVATTLPLAGAESPFCTIAGGVITIKAGKGGIFLLGATVNADTFQPAYELQYSSLVLYHNGQFLTQETISNFSYGEVLVAMNLGTGAYFADGDTIDMVFYTHSQSNDDHGDIVRAGTTTLTLVKVI